MDSDYYKSLQDISKKYFDLLCSVHGTLDSIQVVASNANAVISTILDSLDLDSIYSDLMQSSIKLVNQIMNDISPDTAHCIIDELSSDIVRQPFNTVDLIENSNRIAKKLNITPDQVIAVIGILISVVVSFWPNRDAAEIKENQEAIIENQEKIIEMASETSAGNDRIVEILEDIRDSIKNSNTEFSDTCDKLENVICALASASDDSQNAVSDAQDVIDHPVNLEKSHPDDHQRNNDHSQQNAENQAGATE